MEKENSLFKNTSRLLIVSDSPFISGAENVLLEAIGVFKNIFSEIKFLLLLSKENKKKLSGCCPPFEETIRNLGISTFIYQLKDKKDVFNLKDRVDFKIFLKKNHIDFDIVIFNSPSATALLAPIFWDKIKIYWAHSYRSLFKMGFISLVCNYVFMVSPLMSRYYPFSKNFTVYPHLSLKLDGKPPEEFLFPSGVQLEKGDFLVGSIGRFHPEKHWEEIIYLARKTPEQVKFFHIGGALYHRGEYVKKCRELVKKYKLEGRVYFLGYQKNVQGFIQKMDLIFHPSRNEALVLGPLESMLLEKPVLLYKYPHFPQHVFQNGINCLVYKNKPELIKKFNYFLKNPSFRLRMGRNGKRFVESFFSYENFYQQFFHIFSKILPK